MSISSIVVRGYGVFGDIKYLPTMGYSQSPRQVGAGLCYAGSGIVQGSFIGESFTQGSSVGSGFNIGSSVGKNVAATDSGAGFTEGSSVGEHFGG